jgi:iron complex outermembrane receptor protein
MPAETVPAAVEPAPAAAPALPDAPRVPPEDSGASEGLDEVVVTVDRRRKDLQDYAGTASTFSERQLTSLGLRDVRDLSVMVPGLQIGTQESGTAIFIRGIGSDNFTELGDSAVALHVDGVYMPRPRGLGQMFFDIARVEVNSGPQGTLRGRNAVGGSVNIVTNQPKLGEFQANAQATFASYALRSYQGMVNIPVGDTLALRVAATSLVHDPFWTNAGPIQELEGAQSADNYAIRSILKWQPIQPLEITVAYDYLAERGSGYLGSQFNAELNREDPVDPNSVEDPRRIHQRGWNPETTMWHQGVRGNVTYDAGPVILEAMGSYRDQDYKQLNTHPPGVVLPDSDLSIYNPDEFDGQQWHNTSRATILELRAFAPDDARFRWTLGGFYFHEDQGAFLGQVRDPAGGYGGGEFNMPSTIGTSVAGYADATFDVQEDFRVLGGVRLTRDYKERTGGIWSTWTNTGGLGRFATNGFRYRGFDRADYGIPGDDTTERVEWFLDGIGSFGARDEAAINLCNDPPQAPEGQMQQQRLIVENGSLRCSAGVRDTLPQGIFSIVRQDYDVTDTYVDWRAGAEYDLTRDNLLYLTVTTGHKAAGFNDTLASGDETFNSSFGPESILSVELGSKNLLGDRAFKLNASAFYFTYSGMQFQTIVPVGPPPPRGPDGEVLIDPATNMPFEDNRPGSAVRQNAKEQTNVYGLDVDVIYALPAGLEAEVHALVMDARFSDGTYVNDTRLDPGGVNAQVDLGGNWLPRASLYTLNYTLSQLIYSDVGSFDWVLQGQTRGRHYMTVYNGDGTRLLKKGPEWDPRMDENTNYQGLLTDPSRLTDVVPTYTTFNLSAGWKHPDSRLSVRGYVNNVFDVTYATFIGSGNANNIRYYNDQRMAGVTVRVDW